jgi:hypothetical protein
MAKRPHPGRLRRHPPATVCGICGTATRRLPRRSTLVADPRRAPANPEPGSCKTRSSPAGEPQDHQAIWQAVTHAALGAASDARPQPLSAFEIAAQACVPQKLNAQ